MQFSLFQSEKLIPAWMLTIMDVALAPMCREGGSVGFGMFKSEQHIMGIENIGDSAYCEPVVVTCADAIGKNLQRKMISTIRKSHLTLGLFPHISALVRGTHVACFIPVRGHALDGLLRGIQGAP